MRSCFYGFRQCSRNGFSLIETLIATAIAACVMMALVTITGNSSMALAQAERTSAIDDYAHNQLSKALATPRRPENSSWTVSPDNLLINGTAFYPATHPLFDHEGTASLSVEPLAGVPGLYLVTVAVSYTEPAARTYRASGVTVYQ